MKSEDKRTIRTSKVKQQFDQNAKDMPRLQIDDKLLLYHHDKKNWSIKGQIIRLGDTERSYIVKTDNGSVLARNRKDIKIDKIYKGSKFLGGA